METGPSVNVEILEGDRTLCRSWWQFRNINSPFARLYYLQSGRGSVEHHGRRIPMEPGPLYLVPSRTVSHYSCPFRMDLCWIHITARVNRSLDLFSVLEPADVCRPGRHDDFGALFRQLLAARGRPGVAHRLQAEGLAAYLLSRFFERMPAQEQESRLARVRRFDPVVAFMREHLARPLTLAELAGVLHLHPTYFSNAFARAMGEPPLSYLIRLRVEKAQELLWFTGQSVKQVAARAGFADEFYFSRQFKRRVGCAPLHYRRSRTLPPAAPAGEEGQV